ncbi:MAG: phage portal protein [Hyphomonadaceae bacterium]
MLDWLRRFARSARDGDRKSAPLQMIAWHGLGRPAWSARDYLAFAREGYGRNAVAYRCVRLVAEAAASARFIVTPREHPLAALLAAPNPEQTGGELLEAFYGHLQVAGNAYLEAAGFGDDAPRALYVLRPDRMAVLPGPRGWPIGWEHRAGPHVTRYERDPLTERAPILHLKLFAPADAADAPVAEEREAWRVEIRSGPSLIRAIETAAPAATYAAAAQIADFGSPPASLTVRIGQISGVYGVGTQAESTFTL